MSRQGNFQKLINQTTPLLIDFHATWCGPCKVMEPIVRQLGAEMRDQVRVIKIDIDKNKDLSLQLGVRSVPTFALFQSGQELWRQSGVMTLAQLKHVLTSKLSIT